MSTETKTKKKPAGTGGSKGRAILATIEESGEDGLKRAEIAELVGCTVQRVGEAVRAAEDILAIDDQRRVRMVGAKCGLCGNVSLPTDSDFRQVRAGELCAACEEDPHAEPEPETRTGRCEHEKRAKKKTGSCKTCPPLAE